MSENSGKQRVASITQEQKAHLGAEKILFAVQEKLREDLYSREEKILMKKAMDKGHAEFEEDFIALTVLCYLHENVNSLAITPSKQS